MPTDAAEAGVLRLGPAGVAPLRALLAPAGLRVAPVPAGQAIPGSHWGDEEAGLIGDTLHVRLDTPIHSALHEAGHWLLMTPERRARLHTDAGGSAAEENAVCLLQLVLADAVPPMTRERMFDDMDAWGYSFREGDVRAWFTGDADDARATLAVRLEVIGLAPATMRALRDEALRRRSSPAPAPDPSPPATR